MSMYKLAAAVTALTMLAAPAIAADFNLGEPMLNPTMSATTSDWTGFYISAFGGVAFNPDAPGVLQIDQDLDGDFSEPLVGPLAAAFGVAFSGSRDAGAFGGIAAGYDVQMNQFVVGGIVDIAYVDYSDVQQGFSTTPVAYTETRTVGTMGTLRLKGGYLVTNDLLAYLHGGVAVGDVINSFTSPGNPNGVTTGGQGVQVGYQVGAGVETRVSENVFLGLEYAYTNLGSNDFNTRYANGPFGAANPVGPASDLRGSDRIFDFHTVKASVKYKF
jgi:outer membrane immunogenic protein